MSHEDQPAFLTSGQLCRRWGVTDKWLRRHSCVCDATQSQPTQNSPGQTVPTKEAIPYIWLGGRKKYRLTDIQRIEEEGGLPIRREEGTHE